MERVLGRQPKSNKFPFPFSNLFYLPLILYFVNFSSLILSCFVLVVIFKFLEVLKLVLK